MGYKLFTYGTLMKGQCRHHALKDAKYLGDAVLRDYCLLELGSYPGAIPKEGSNVYGEVYEMVTNPGKYIGKTVKMEGIYYPYHVPEEGIFYNTCVIPDATACCQQGIEFELLDGDYKYETEDIIRVVGTFDTYYEGDMMYCILRNAYYAD